MNTSFHTPGIDRAYASLALTSSVTALHIRIGSQRLEIPMVSSNALKGTLQQLQRVTERSRNTIRFDRCRF